VCARKKRMHYPPPHGGRRTDQRKGTRLIFLGHDRGCGMWLARAMAERQRKRARRRRWGSQGGFSFLLNGPKYMAPETLGYEPKFNKSADIFSFAILMWEVMVGQSAYADPKFDWPSKIEKFVMKGKRIDIPHEMDFRIAQLIQDCWHQDPEKRPSITTVIQELSTFVYN
jgi:hypothetical protein